MNKLFSSLWFKCITVLLVISVVLGGLLAVANDVFYVSPEERTSRAIKKIYGEDKQYEVIIDVDTLENGYDCGDIGTVNKLFIVGDKTSESFDYLFQTTGKQGYKGGSITVWVQVNVSNGTLAISKVVQESYEKQTLMSKITQGWYDNFNGPINDSNGFDTTINPVSGATYSAQAGCNAINCVIEYAQANLIK